MLCGLVGPSSLSAASPLFTVREAIKMQTFIDPYPFSPTSLLTQDVKFSPDNRFFAVVTQRGLLSTNQLESTIWVFDVRAVRQFLDHTHGAEHPEPRAVVRMRTAEIEPSITELRWLPNGKLAFLGRDKTADRSLFTLDVTTGTLRRLTPDGQDVIQFDIVKDVVAYTVAIRGHKLPKTNETVLTGQSILSLLEGESTDGAEKPVNLWILNKSRASAVMDAATGKPIQLITDMLSVSPSGRFVVVTQHADRIPETWEEYEPAFSGLSDEYQLKASAPTRSQEELLIRPKQYALVDLDVGKIEAIDAPLGEALLYYSPKRAIWTKDSRRVLLLNTFLPLEKTGESERRGRAQKSCVALFDTNSRDATCVAFLKQSGLEEYFRDGTLYLLNDAAWSQSEREVVLKYKTYGDKEGSKHSEDPTETYRSEKGVWTQVKSASAVARAPLWVGVSQDLNQPPALFASDESGGQPQQLWDPNPQLKFINLGEVSLYKWQDKAGREWIGGLIKPPDYMPGHRYPLVIQAHGFNRHEFMSVGTFTTAFAARPLAATGMLVLQIQDASDLLGTPREASVNVQGYESAIDHLVADDLVDPERVGLIGFSRSGYYALEALTKTPDLFAAATIADSDFMGYMQRLLGVDLAGDWPKKDGIAIYGSQPFGEGLKTWMQMAPAFNLDKVVAPVRIEVHDLSTVLMNWEVYAGLRLQNKPVDLIQLPDAAHVVTKPRDRLASEQGDVDWFDFWLNAHEDRDPAKAEQYERWRSFREQHRENGRPRRLSVVSP
ncbi:MAG TPA: prolyl oligopeptidase family serine peptidase [Terriglobales bacterium]|jgi:dipeptidyl aminopeptidase/acylaminoacyl peptidase|nr:prolyl oligopeptidase family serine peptidase [Terriglobales bacterium]